MPISLNLAQALNQVTPLPSPSRTISRIEAVEKTAQYKAAAYCRVSTDNEDQEGSIEVQRDHFLSVITSSPEMSFVDIYFEQGVSGTKKETRPELQRLLTDCKRGKVNLVLTKSISRFARNTTDCLEMVRSLTALGVILIFEKENIDTRFMDSEFLLTILASLAENESRSFSDNNRWAIQKRFRDGTYRPAKAPFGYDLVDGKFVINPYEAEKVRAVFDLYLSGVGPTEIAATFNRQKVPLKRTGEKWKEPKKSEWSSNSISAILQNIAYVGDFILQQSFTDHNFKMKPNKGEYPKFLVENHHEPLIDRDVFLCTQELMEQRRKESGSVKGRVPQNHLLTRRIKCGCCGSIMTRSSQRLQSGKRYAWRCMNHTNTDEAVSILEDSILNGLDTVVNKLRFLAPVIPIYVNGLEQEWKKTHEADISPLEIRLKEIHSQKSKIQFQFSHNSIEAAAYYSQKNELETEERLLQTESERMACSQAEEMKRMQKVLGNITRDNFLNEFVERIEIPNRFYCDYCLTCGLRLREKVMIDTTIE